MCFYTALLLFLPCLYYFLSTNFFPQCLWLCQLNVCEIIPSLWSSRSVFHLYVTIVKCTIQSYPLWETVIYSCHHLMYYVPLTMISICIHYINSMYVALALNQSVSKFWNSDFLINNGCLYDYSVYNQSFNMFQMQTLRKILLCWIFCLYSSCEWDGDFLTFFLVFRQNTNQQ